MTCRHYVGGKVSHLHIFYVVTTGIHCVHFMGLKHNSGGLKIKCHFIGRISRYKLRCRNFITLDKTVVIIVILVVSTSQKY